jgi:predicted NBD/HSP70 family sugar kinase
MSSSIPTAHPAPAASRGCFRRSPPARIARAARAAIDAGEDTTLPRSEPTAADVFTAAEAGDPVARLVDAAAEAIARIVHALVLAYDVELVVIGGGTAAPVRRCSRDPGRPRPDRRSIRIRRALGETDVRLAAADHDIGTWGTIALLNPVAKEVVAREAGDERETRGSRRWAACATPFHCGLNRGGEHRCT